MPPDRIVVLSLHKAGTNLISEFLARVGYSPIGEGIASSYEEVKRILSKGPLSLDDPNAVLSALLDNSAPGAAVFVHQITLPSTGFRPAPFFDAWLKSQTPRIIFNYRDPRAVCSSLVRYLTEPGRKAASNWPWGMTQRQILTSMKTAGEQLDYVIDCLGDHFDRLYTAHLWALKHPGVLKVRYEDLVGPEGGGSTSLQRESAQRILSHLSIAVDVEEACKAIYNPGARTFQRGRIDTWRDEFSVPQMQRFVEKHRDIFEAYGYEAVS